MQEASNVSRSTGEQGSSWPKKKLVKVLFALTLTWGILSLSFLQSKLVKNTDNFRSQSPSSLIGKEDQHKKLHLPRLIYLGTIEELTEHTHQMQQQTQAREIDVNFRSREFDEECVAMGSWQESSFPNCNQIHEMGLLDK
eukprot:scaffold7352_cov73-Skeletonema_marinoi.AAC.1